MSITLKAIPRADLEVLAESGVPDSVAGRVADESLPPSFVARRALARPQEGEEACRGGTFYMVRGADHLVVGSCGFKDAPLRGRVEIGYGVSPACRNQGVATRAVRELLRLAFASEAVCEVVATVSPGNVASTRVVQKLGFVDGGMILDDDGEWLARWVFRKPPDDRLPATADVFRILAP